MRDLIHSNYVVTEVALVRDVMESITFNHRGAAVVIDRSGQVVGVVSDGDLRRAMVRGAIAETPVSKCLNQNFVSVAVGATAEEQQALFKQHPEINVLPVVDKNNKLVDLVVRGGPHQPQT